MKNRIDYNVILLWSYKKLKKIYIIIGYSSKIKYNIIIKVNLLILLKEQRIHIFTILRCIFYLYVHTPYLNLVRYEIANLPWAVYINYRISTIHFLKSIIYYVY